VSDRIHHLHVETPYDDWAIQPLLPNRFSQMGPGVCFVDLDHDGWADLVIGGSRGNRPAFFLNNRNGGFDPLKNSLPGLAGDQDAVLALQNGVTVTISNYKGARVAEPSAIVCAPVNGSIEAIDALPGQLASATSLALGDVDGDGQPELFVG